MKFDLNNIIISENQTIVNALKKLNTIRDVSRLNFIC